MLKRILLVTIVIGLYFIYLLPVYAGDGSDTILQLVYVEDSKSGSKQSVIRERIKRNGKNHKNTARSVSKAVNTYDND